MAKKKGNRRVRSASRIAINDAYSNAGVDGDALMAGVFDSRGDEDY